MESVRIVQGIMTALFLTAFIAIAYRIAKFSSPTVGTIIFILALTITPFLTWKLWQLWGDLLE
jgi:hypothetical protein